MVILLYLCIGGQNAGGGRDLCSKHTSSPSSLMHIHLSVKKGGKNQGEQCNWNSECFVVPGDICISPEGPPAELILFLGPFSLLCPLSPFEEGGEV